MITIVKYNNNGFFQWYENYFSGGSNEDYTTDIATTSTGDIYVSASSKNDATDFDFLALKFNNSGTLQWDTRYDYDGLVDFSINVELESNKVIITGASASSPTRWDFTTVVLDHSNGDIVDETRDGLSWVGYDVPTGFTKDISGNYYLTGRSSTDGINYDLRVIKLDTAFNILWSNTVDYAEKKDEGLSVAVDTLGGVYVGGYVTRADNVEEMFIVKYNQNGDFQWKHQQPGNDPTKDARITAVDINSKGELYYVGQESKKNEKIRPLIGKLNSDGKTIYQRNTDAHSSMDEFPTTLRIDNDDYPYFTAIVDDLGNYHYVIRKYSEFTQSKDYEVDLDTVPLFKSNELLIRFKQSALVDSMFYKEYQGKKIEFDSLQHFLTEQAMGVVDNALKNFYTGWDSRTPNPEGIIALKVFKDLKPNYTSTISRLGDTISIPDFWTTLLISIPPTLSLEDVYTAIKTELGILAYVEPNFYVQPFNDYTDEIPNDPNFGLQESFFSYYYENGNINALEAWYVYPEGGKEYIKCGILDDGVAFWHPDFGYTYSDSINYGKIRDGWDMYAYNTMYSAQNNIKGHGTPSAGIIGAIKDNNQFVAGLAGGDYSGNYSVNDPNFYSDKGVSIYSIKIIDDEEPDFFPDNPAHTTYEAIVNSSIDDTSLLFGYGLHISNNSWGIRIQQMGTLYLWMTDTNFMLLKEATRFANRAQVSFVACRGNEGTNNLVYPAIIDDDWIINVGGTGYDGEYKSGNSNGWGNWSPSYGRDVDISAPSTHYANWNSWFVTSTSYNPSTGLLAANVFGGTSAATPHVSGVIALLMSYLNDSIPSYANLAPEDAEKILELTAINYADLGLYSDSVGWGKLDAGKAMRLVEKPWNTVHHFGTNNQFQHQVSYQLESSNTPFYLKEQVQNYEGLWFDKGNYLANVWAVKSKVYHSINPIDTIVSYWPRPSSSTVLEPIINDSLLPRERLSITQIDTDSCFMVGYIYEVLDTLGNPLGWLPISNSVQDARFEYTILSRDSTAPIANNPEIHLENGNISLFPNPTQQQHALELNGYSNKHTVITLYDINGRLIRKIHDGKIVNNHEVFYLDVSDLSTGLYFYNIIFETEQGSIRFIKQ